MKSLYILSDSTGVGQFVSIHKTWPVLLAQYLEGRYIVQNMSKNGETSRQALERLYPDVLRYEPSIVYIQYGINDANCWKTDKGMPRVTIPEFRANIITLCERCLYWNTSVIMGNNHTDAYNPVADGISIVLDNAFDNYYYVDHSHYTGDYMLDAVHLNERGHQLYFENIAQAIP